MNEMILSAAKYLEHKIANKIKPEIAIILGTGLNSFAEIVDNPQIIPYEEIPGFCISTAPSHQGRLIFGTISDVPVLLMQGRLHFYEGYSMQEITFPVRVMAKIGIKKMIVTNAAGSLNEKIIPGSIVTIKDHINFMGTNPLIGKNLDNFGERFPSLHEPYDHKMIELFHEIATEKDIKIHTGVYVAVTGPSFETHAECSMMAKWGADLVGMSTIPEVIVGKHSGLRILGISVATNFGNIFHSKSHTQEEIRANAGKAQKNLQEIIFDLLKRV